MSTNPKIECTRAERIILLLLFTTFFSAMLKIIFGNPSIDSLSKAAVAFPSGHTQAATVLWLSIYTEFKNKIVKVSSLIILFVILLCIWYKQYHTLHEILGGFAFGVVEIAIFYHLIKAHTKKIHFLVISLGLLVISIPCYLLATKYKFNAYLHPYFVSYILFTLVNYLLIKKADKGIMKIIFKLTLFITIFFILFHWAKK